MTSRVNRRARMEQLDPITMTYTLRLRYGTRAHSARINQEHALMMPELFAAAFKYMNRAVKPPAPQPPRFVPLDLRLTPEQLAMVKVMTLFGTL